jgi:hypothetical protein
MPRLADARGREAARPYESKETKPAKIDSLFKKNFCNRPLKDLSIFMGFVRRVATPSSWPDCGALPARRLLLISHFRFLFLDL